MAEMQARMQQASHRTVELLSQQLLAHALTHSLHLKVGFQKLRALFMLCATWCWRIMMLLLMGNDHSARPTHFNDFRNHHASSCQYRVDRESDLRGSNARLTMRRPAVCHYRRQSRRTLRVMNASENRRGVVTVSDSRSKVALQSLIVIP